MRKGKYLKSPCCAIHSKKSSCAKHLSKPLKKKSKLRILIVLAVVLPFFVVSNTVAYLIWSGNITNDFVIGSVDNTVSENFNGNIKKNVKIENTGNTEAYIRVAIVPVWLESTSSGKNVLPLEVDNTYDIDLNTTDWFKANDGYYYYKYKVSANESTNDLINECKVNSDLSSEYSGKNFELQILSSSIQAKPNSAVEDAWPCVKVDNAGNLVENV